MEDENILIDQLEDQLIDNPDALTTKQLEELSYDETFQKKLNERGDQFTSGGNWGPGSDENGNPGNIMPLMVRKPLLAYTYADMGPLKQELAEWFTSGDYSTLGLDGLRETKPVELAGIDFSGFEWTETCKELDFLVYHVLGEFASTSSAEEQLEHISTNCTRVMETGLHFKVIDLLLQGFKHCISGLEKGSDQLSTVFSANYLKILTIVYFVTNVALSNSTTEKMANAIQQSDLLVRTVQFIDKWNQYPSPVSRIRNVITLFWKLLLVDFGTTAQLAKVDQFLVQKHNIKNKDRKNAANNHLTCSPLDYFTFRENLMDKYPMHTRETAMVQERDAHSPELISLLESESEFMAANSYSNSLSNLLEMPRTNKAHTVLGQLPIQTVHIATPVPSPPTTPSEFMSGGEKIRKQYHVNQGVPFVYPANAMQDVPEAIREAQDLMVDAVYESYSVKRMWDERQLFMAQERGNIDQYGEKGPVEDFESNIMTNEDRQFESEIRSLQRVEHFYQSSIVHLHGLVEVLVGVVKSNKYEFDLKNAGMEFDTTLSFSSRFGGASNLNNKVQQVILHQLELEQLKELLLKATSAILIQLMKWFKVSHVLKSHYFGSLLFDQQYFVAFVDFLGCSFNNSALQDTDDFRKGTAQYDILTSQNKLMNPAVQIPQFNFWNKCQNTVPLIGPISLINKTPVADLPSFEENNETVIHIKQFNENFAFILTNLLNVTNKILIKNISQRVFVFNETKSTDLLKVILLNFINDEFRSPILKIFKKLIPYQGRKWRALNMDVISLIYLHLKLSLKDNWLSGKDLECDFNNSFDQEVALRSLLQFYNIRKYPEQMLSLGYALSPDTIPQLVDLDESIYN